MFNPTPEYMKELFAVQHRNGLDMPAPPNRLQVFNIAFQAAVGKPVDRETRLRTLSVLFGFKIESTKDLKAGEVTAFLTMVNSPLWGDMFRAWVAETVSIVQQKTISQ